MPRQSYYDEVEIEDFKWDPEKKVFHYPCPCGDRFEITKGQLRDGDDVATCPSCSLLLRVVYEWVSCGVINFLANVLNLVCRTTTRTTIRMKKGKLQHHQPKKCSPHHHSGQ